MRGSEDDGASGGVAVRAVETILVVDSEAPVRMAIAAYLRDCGYRVIEAANAEEALTVIDHETAVSAVLAAVESLGATTCFELASQIRRRRPGLGVVLAGTVAREAEAAGELCEQGPLLARPYDPQIVLDRIRRLLASRPRP
jgi:DNA-binding response OmpR family regulator